MNLISNQLQRSSIPTMKTRLLNLSLGLLAALVVGGCGQSNSSTPKSTNTSSSGNPLTAPVDYLGAANQAQKRAGKVVSTVGLDQAVKMYYATEGKYPASLEALAPDYLQSVPPAPAGMKYNYDPKTGVIKVEAK